jgi:hypothetical protein
MFRGQLLLLMSPITQNKTWKEKMDFVQFCVMNDVISCSSLGVLQFQGDYCVG